MKRLALTIGWLLAVLGSSAEAHPGEAGAGRELSVVLRDADYIVVGHLTADPIQPSFGGVSRHLATLVVSRVIKGEYREPMMRIVFHHEMEPTLVRGKQPVFEFTYVTPPPGPWEQIELMENNLGTFSNVGNLREDRVWLLTKVLANANTRLEGDLEPNDPPGVWETVDVQPLEFEKTVRTTLGLPLHKWAWCWWAAGALVPIAAGASLFWRKRRRRAPALA